MQKEASVQANEKILNEKNETEQSNKFLGTEKIGKLLCKFAIPCVLAMVIQALYNIVDQLFIGNASYLGEAGNSATGIVYPLTVIAVAVGYLLGDGTAALISLNQGRNNTKNTSKSVGSAISIAAIFGILFMVICLVFGNQILALFNQTEEVTSFASQYLVCIAIGFPFYVVGTAINPIIRTDGSPKFAMIAMSAGAVVNIILDPIFIFACHWGMTGAAVATLIGQIVTFSLSIFYLFRTKTFKLKMQDFLIKWKATSACLKLGISSFLTQFSIAVVSIVNNVLLGIYMPNDSAAAGMLTVAFKVFGIVVAIAIGIASGGQPIVGYNYGAKKFDRVKKTFFYMLTTAFVVGVIATLLFTLLPSQLLGLFGFNSSGAYNFDFGINCFRIYLSFILLTCLTKVVSIFFQAVGKPVRSALITMVRDMIALVPVSLIFVVVGGIDLFLWSAPVSDAIALILSVAFLIPFFKSISQSKTETESESKSGILVQEEKELQTAGKLLPTHAGRVITISREHGAGGREIAIALAKALKVPFYDKEVASMVAKESGLSAEFVNAIDEKTSNFNTLYLGTEATQMAIAAQTKLLNKIAESGACVILGRAADFVLKDYDPFSIFIYANQDYKKQRIMKNYGDDEKTALQNMEKSDKHRAKFYKDFSGKEWGKRENYSLCIDSSVGVEKTVEIILQYLKPEEDEKPKKSGKKESKKVPAAA